MHPILPDLSYRRPTGADLPRVNALYRREYGDAYPYQLTPDDLAGERDIAFVAEAADGVVACARAVRSRTGAPVFMFGGMIVDPAHRRNHVARRLTELRFDAVRDAGGMVVVTEPVCCQPTRASQRNMIAHGFTPLGILPAKYPDIKPETLGDQPETLTLAVKWMRDEVSFEGRRLCVPDRVAGLVRDTAPRLLGTAGSRAPAGDMPDPEWHEPMPGARGDGSAFVDVPMNWPESADALAALERRGLAVCGFLPGLGLTARGERYDLARLVDPRGRRVRFEHIHVTDELGAIRDHLVRFCGE